MRHVDLGPKFEALSGTGATKEYSAMDIGVGLNFELDTAELQPQVGKFLHKAVYTSICVYARGWEARSSLSPSSVTAANAGLNLTGCGATPWLPAVLSTSHEFHEKRETPLPLPAAHPQAHMKLWLWSCSVAGCCPAQLA